MKKFFKLLPFFFAAISLFSSCSDNDNDDLYPSELTKGAYIVNYGGYEKATSSITKYDFEADEITEFYYQLQNNYAEITSAPEFAYEYEDRIYLMNNAPDNIIAVDPLFVAQDTITTSIVKPRACVGNGDYLYISCWGGSVWTDASVSYLVKYNVVTKTVEKTISLPGGPEGIQVANGKLYVALNYQQAIAVMDLSTEEISYIATPAVSSNLVKDSSGNLYVALVSTYSYASSQTGLGYINTTTDELTVYELDNVSTSYASILALSKDQSKVYVVAAAYDASWNMVGGVQVFDVASKSFEASALVSGVTGVNGVSVNPNDGKVYVLVSNGSTTKGTMQIYDADGTYEETKTVGAAPTMTIFLD
ncbi:hypothetical protein [Mangrovibacterium sp.]|uniref:hypothetical protein n=1 Tax=Mangrovibacterium sp. TaxID=1961364 RepID=UPI003565AD62